MTMLVRAEGLVKRYRLRARPFSKPSVVHSVNGLSLTLERGETLGLVGESGCGKSTTGRLLLGIDQPDAGQILFNGEPMPDPTAIDWRRLRARMQMVFQDPLGTLDPSMAIGDQIKEPLSIHGLGTGPESRQRVRDLLVAVGLSGAHENKYPSQLSGGQRQRASLARALATKPDLLVCDEPISALDVSIQAQILNLLSDLQAEFGMGIVFISHDLRAVRQISHRVAVMYLGQIVEEGPTNAVIGSPQHPYARALVSAVPGIGAPSGQHGLLLGEPPNPIDRPSGCSFHPRCAMATSICRSVTPALRTLGDGRKTACHLVSDTPPEQLHQGVF